MTFFMDVVSDSTQKLIFKKLPLVVVVVVSAGVVAKKTYNYGKNY